MVSLYNKNCCYSTHPQQWSLSWHFSTVFVIIKFVVVAVLTWLFWLLHLEILVTDTLGTLLCRQVRRKISNTMIISVLKQDDVNGNNGWKRNKEQTTRQIRNWNEYSTECSIVAASGSLIVCKIILFITQFRCISSSQRLYYYIVTLFLYLFCWHPFHYLACIFNS